MPLFYLSQVTAYLRFPVGADRIWVTKISSFAHTYYRSLGVIIPGTIVERLFKGLSGGILAVGVEGREGTTTPRLRYMVVHLGPSSWTKTILFPLPSS